MENNITGLTFIMIVIVTIDYCAVIDKNIVRYGYHY